MRVILIAFTNIEYTIQLAEALASLVDLILMIPRQQATRFKQVIDPTVQVHPFDQPRLRQLTNLNFVVSMIKRVHHLSPDVIHIQRGHPWFNFSLPFLKQYPLVTTIHDVVLHSGDRESAVVPPFTHKLAIRYARQIIVHGHRLKQEMLEKYKLPDDKVNVLRRGINSIYTRYCAEKQEEQDTDTILFFGRIWEYKGLRYLIEAEPLITRRIPSAKIVIGGRGENLEKYRKMMVNKEAFVVHDQFIPDVMVSRLFRQASLVVFPYTDASQSGVIPIAYAFGKPVVVTNVGSLPEVVDDGITGLIVPPRDSAKLAEAIIELLLDDQKRRRMGECAFKKGTEELSWSPIAQETIKVYQKALSESPRHR